MYQGYHNQPSAAQLRFSSNLELPVFTNTGVPLSIVSKDFWKQVQCQYGSIEFDPVNRRNIPIWEHAIGVQLKRTIFLDRISVVTGMREQGIADALMLKAMKIVDDLGFSIITYITPYDRSTDFERLVELFSRFGFKLIYENRECIGREYAAMYRPQSTQFRLTNTD